ncbi:hypothetical protein ScPMuIL_006051 [Solemya velum]
MGAKHGKHRDSESESPHSPRKSPKRSSKGSSRSPSDELTPSSYDPVQKETESPSVEESVVTKSVKIAESKPKSPIKREHRDDEKENMPHMDLESSPRTPQKMVIKELEPLTPLIVNDISNRVPIATSTPAPHNGIVSTGSQASSPPRSPNSGDTDQSDDEAFSPSDHKFELRSPSPTSSLTSQSTNGSGSAQGLHSEASLDRRSETDFGKFYKTSYLKDGMPYLKRASLNPQTSRKSPHFHRPAHFSYTSDKPDFLQTKKSILMYVIVTVAGKTVVRKVRRSSSPADLRNEEAVRLSMFPGAKPPKPNEIVKIEREDWPGPPSPAAILPEILRQRRKSRGEKEDEDEDWVPEDPRIKKEIEEISKFKDTSGIGKIIYDELRERKLQPPKPLDPWKASRVPGADHEPRYRTRFQSPMFASPSRFVDRPKRSWDDSDIQRGYRTMSTFGNFPVPKPGYGLSPKAATLPLSGLFGGPLDFRYYNYEDSGREPEGHPTTEGEHKHKHSTHTSTSTVNTDTSSKRESRSRGSSIYDGPGVSLMTFQRSSWHTEAQPPIYPYEELKISNFKLPVDVDRNQIELHLSEDEFQSIFRLTKEEFRRMPEWKRNDVKRRADLY